MESERRSHLSAGKKALPMPPPTCTSLLLPPPPHASPLLPPPPPIWTTPRTPSPYSPQWAPPSRTPPSVGRRDLLPAASPHPQSPSSAHADVLFVVPEEISVTPSSSPTPPQCSPPSPHVWLPRPLPPQRAPPTAAKLAPPQTLPWLLKVDPGSGRPRLSHRRPTPPWPPRAPSPAAATTPWQASFSVRPVDADGIEVVIGDVQQQSEIDRAENYHVLHIENEGTVHNGDNEGANQGCIVIGSNGGGNDAPGGGNEGSNDVPGVVNEHGSNDAPGGIRNRVRDAIGNFLDSPAAALLFVVFMYAAYHAVLIAVSYWVKATLSDKEAAKWGNLIWSFVWLCTFPFLVYPHIKLYGHAVNRRAINRAAREGDNPPAANEHQFGVVNANALMMFLGGGARIVYVMVGNSWPLVTIAHAVGFLVEVMALGMRYWAEGVVNVQLPEV